MAQRIDLIELREHFGRGDDLFVLHYGCENLYAATNHPASISCIAFCRVGRAEAGSFSVVDAPEGTERADAEIGALTAYFDFLQRNGSAAYAHWNMSKPDYGFTALEARYKHLTGEDAPHRISRDRTYDLDDLVKHEFGDDYAPHPRLISLAALNGLSRHQALAGGAEAERFEQGDHGAVRRSIDEKAHWISVLCDRFLTGKLKTTRSAGSLTFARSNLDAVQTVLDVGRRFLYVQRELAQRHGSRPTLDVNDEYDAQDLFRSLLKLFFDDVRPEEWVPSYAGGATRMDFFLKEFGLAVELKHSRESMSAKSLGEELVIDSTKYGTRADVNHLVCLVFDHLGRLDNPRGLENDLSAEVTQQGIAVTVLILDR